MPLIEAFGLGAIALQVVDKDASAVLDEVEASLYRVALSVLQGEGFAYDVPSRCAPQRFRFRAWSHGGDWQGQDVL